MRQLIRKRTRRTETAVSALKHSKVAGLHDAIACVQIIDSDHATIPILRDHDHVNVVQRHDDPRRFRLTFFFDTRDLFAS